MKLDSIAKENNIALIYSSFISAHMYFTWGGCPPYKDKSMPTNYDYTPYVVRTGFNNYKEKIILPGDFRTSKVPITSGLIRHSLFSSLLFLNR